MALHVALGQAAALSSTATSDHADLGEDGANELPENVDVLPLELLDMVSFGDLVHANGSASDVPGLLGDLMACANDGEAAEECMDKLSNLLISRGTLYTSSSAVVPYLAHIVLSSSCFETKLNILRFLVFICMTSSDTYFPSVKKRVCKASTRLIASLDFSPFEPSVKNLSACFFALVAPPEDDKDRSALAKMFKPTLGSNHPKFRLLAQIVRSVLLRQPSAQAIDLEQLETELFESAEEWEAQAGERERLLMLAKSSQFKGLPTDINRRVKSFLYASVSV